MGKLDVNKMKKWVKTTALLGTISVVMAGCSWNMGFVDQISSSLTAASPNKGNSTDQSNGTKNNHTKNSSSSKNQKSKKSSEKQTQKSSKKKHDNNKPFLKKTVKVMASGKHVVTNPSSILVCADKHRNLPASYVPPHLVIPNIRFIYGKNAHYEKMHLRKVAAGPIEQLFKAADKDGVQLYGISGYRSYQYQVSVFAQNVRQYGSKQKANQVSAEPGQSEHQTGLSMDVSSASVNYQLIQKFGNTKAGKWLAANGWKYGFIIRYPKGKENITGYEYEPWHIRYVGKKPAKVIHKNHLTLEEYLSR